MPSLFQIGDLVRFTEKALAAERAQGYTTQNPNLKNLLDGNAERVTMVYKHKAGHSVYIGTRENNTLLALDAEDFELVK